jgi:hypothetical protein
MLEFLEDWLDRRRTKALLWSLAEWQNDPSRELGEFGLSVTTDISSPASQALEYICIKFTLHHSSGGYLNSGTYRLPCANVLHDDSEVDNVESGYFDWLPDVAGPLLNEFLLPSGVSDGYQRSAKFEPLRLVEP